RYLNAERRIVRQREDGSYPDRLNARTREELTFQLLKEATPLVGAFVPRPVEVEPGGHDTRRIEARFHSLQVRHGSQQQCGSHEQHERDADLEDDQPVPYPRMRSAGSRAA